MADIIGEISSASQQQAAGLDQVNGAITHMDEGTQQNAAMAEETSAVAASMSEQAKKLTDMISVFKIRSEGGRQSQQPVVRTQVAAAAPKKQPVRVAAAKPTASAPQPMKKAAGSDVEWQEF